MALLDESTTYDEAFAELEAVLSQLEGADLPLEQALALYERGAALADHCARKLEQAELRVNLWQPGNGGKEGQARPFEGWSEG